LRPITPLLGAAALLLLALNGGRPLAQPSAPADESPGPEEPTTEELLARLEHARATRVTRAPFSRN
jgi:hypothetical protein